jgi:hypothetical protein
MEGKVRVRVCRARFRLEYPPCWGCSVIDNPGLQWVVKSTLLFMLLSPPKPDFASKRPGVQECSAPSGALLSKRSEVASSCRRATERPLYGKVETTPE